MIGGPSHAWLPPSQFMVLPTPASSFAIGEHPSIQMFHICMQRPVRPFRPSRSPASPAAALHATACTAESRAVEPLAEPEVVETIDVHNLPASAPAPAATARDSSVPAAAAVAAASAADDDVDPDDPPRE